MTKKPDGGHAYLRGYGYGSKGIRAAGGNDFHSTARVTLVPMPWDVTA